MTLQTVTEPWADLIAPGVEWHVEACRHGRELVTLVDRESGWVVYASPDDIIAGAALGDSSVAQDLRNAGLLVDHPAIAAVAADRRPDFAPGGSGLVWRGADGFVRRCHTAALHRLFTRRALVVQGVVALVGVVAALFTLFGRHDVQLQAQPEQIPLIIILGLVAVAIHELGHALVTVHYGRHVTRAGLRLHFGAPAFYVDSIDSLLLSRRQRILQAAAGPWLEWMFTSIAAMTVLLVPADSDIGNLLRRFVIVNTIGIVLNLVPFAGLDGALLLSDIIREPDLTTRAPAALVDRSTRAATGRWVLGYAVANSAVGALLLLFAAFFWWQLFGSLVELAWSQGPLGVTAVAAGTMLLVRYAVTAGVRNVAAVAAVAVVASRAHAAAVFRAERRWRVQAINAFRALPELADLDALELGVLAGHLEKVNVAERHVWLSGGHLYIRRRLHYIPRRLHPTTAARSRVIAANETTTVPPGATVVHLPDRWRELLTS